MTSIKCRYEFEVSQGLSGLQSLKKQWTSLHQHCDLGARFEIYDAFARHLIENGENLFLIRIFSGEATIAIIPTTIHSISFGELTGIRVIGMPEPYVCPHDFPIHPQAKTNLIAQCMLEAFRFIYPRWEVVRWNHVAHSSNALAVCKAMTDQAALIRPSNSCNWLDASLNFSALQSRFSKNLQANLKKARKKLGPPTAWNVGFSRLPDNLGENFSHFSRLEASGWKGSDGTKSAINLNQNINNFYRHLIAMAGDDFAPEIALLCHEGSSIAGQLSICTRGTKHIVKIGYDEAYARLSPGQILLEEVLSEACQSPSIKKVSLVSDMPWHHTWRPQSENAYEITFFRHRLIGRIAGWYGWVPFARSFPNIISALDQGSADDLQL